jgi:hypothetical protein
MERRLNTRYRGTGCVYVALRGQKPRRFRIGNLSARGVFVESPSFSLPLDTAVDLVFVVSIGKIVKIYHRKAIVAHRSKRGMGMLLHRSYQHGTAQGLRASPL